MKNFPQIMENQKLNKFIEDNLDSFHNFLSNFQEDITKLVGKFRRSYHLMSVEDIISEINFDLVKKSDVFLRHCFEDDTCSEELTFNIFQKYAVTFIKNKVKWTHYAPKLQKYNDRKQDSWYFTEDGVKTTFDIATENKGVVDDNFENFDKYDNLKNFFHIIDKYSELLTPQEREIIPFLSRGWTHERIAQNFGVTHQAIQQRIANVKEKSRSRFDIQSVISEDVSGISKGINAIESIFSPKENSFTEKYRKILIDFVKTHPKKYTAKEINKVLFKNKFKTQQISSSLVRCKLHGLLRKPGLPRNIKHKIKEHLKNGWRVARIAKQENVPINSVRGIRSKLVANGELKSFSDMKLDIEKKLIEGVTPKYIQSLYKDFSLKSILAIKEQLN